MLYDIKHLHLELSSLCNARCPFCPRNFYGYPYNFGYNETNLSLKDVQSVFVPETVAGLREILINGNFGDFVMNPESVDIIEYFLSHNKNLEVIVSTNGGARDRHFWNKLGSFGIKIIFCIDGLEDTNHLYRQDVDWDNVMKNAETFIAAGGRAHWKMVAFDHNSHQRKQAQEIADKMGFIAFYAKQSKRSEGPVYDRTGKKTHVIHRDKVDFPTQITSDWLNQSINRHLQRTVNITGPANIVCWAQKNQSIYLSADGHVYPCCWIGFNPSEFRPLNSHGLWNKEIGDIVRHNHAPTVGLQAALEWFDDLAQRWHSQHQPEACKFFCGDKNHDLSD